MCFQLYDARGAATTPGRGDSPSGSGVSSTRLERVPGGRSGERTPGNGEVSPPTRARSTATCSWGATRDPYRGIGARELMGDADRSARCAKCCESWCPASGNAALPRDGAPEALAGARGRL